MNRTENTSNEYLAFLEKVMPTKSAAYGYTGIQRDIYTMYRSIDHKKYFIKTLREAEEKRMEHTTRWLNGLERQQQIYQLYDETTPERVQSLPKELQLLIIEFIEPQVILSRKLGFISKQLNWCRGYLYPIAALETSLKDLPLKVIYKLFKKYNLDELKNCPKKEDTLRSLFILSLRYLNMDTSPIINFTDPKVYDDKIDMGRIPILFKLLLSFKVFLEVKKKLVVARMNNKDKIRILNSGSSI